METNPPAHTAGVGFFVRAGSRDEPSQVMGVSHFLEHMMFKGTARRTAQDINCQFDGLGAQYNAFTSHESTVYYAQVLPEHVASVTELLADMMHPALRVEDFEVEKQVILEEIEMYEDHPAWRLQDALLETHFQGHGLAHRVLGTKQSISALTLEELQSYHQQKYRTENMFFVAAGRVQAQALIEQLEQLTRSWPQGGEPRNDPCPRFQPSCQHLVDDQLQRHYLMLAIPGPSAQDDDRFAMRVLTDILGDAKGSRLYWALVDPGWADEASVSFEPQDRSGLCLAFASCDPPRREQVASILNETIADLASWATAIEPSELQRAKNKLATQATLAGEQPMGRMSSLGTSWLYLNRYVPLEEELARILAVTADDLQRLLQRWPITSYTQVSLGPRP